MSYEVNLEAHLGLITKACVAKPTLLDTFSNLIHSSCLKLSNYDTILRISLLLKHIGLCVFEALSPSLELHTIELAPWSMILQGPHRVVHFFQMGKHSCKAF